MEPERIALQLLHAPPAADPQVVAELRAAAASARERAAPETTANLLTRALAEPPQQELRGELLVELGDAELRSGRAAQAIENLRQAYRLAADPQTRARALFVLAQASQGERRTLEGIAKLIEDTLPELKPLDQDLAVRLRSILIVQGSGEQPELPCDTAEEAVIIGDLDLRPPAPGRQRRRVRGDRRTGSETCRGTRARRRGQPRVHGNGARVPLGRPPRGGRAPA